VHVQNTLKLQLYNTTVFTKLPLGNLYDGVSLGYPVIQCPTLDSVAVGVARRIVGASVVTQVAVSRVAPARGVVGTVVAAVVRRIVVVRIRIAVTVVRSIVVATVAWQGC